jgi:hypothetical protein
LSKDSDVFLIDHVWTSNGGRKAKQDLLSDTNLLSRLEAMFGIQHSADTRDPNFVGQQVATVMKVANVKSEEARRLLNSTHFELIPALMMSNDSSGLSDNEKQQLQSVSFEEFKAGLASSFEDQLDNDEHVRKLYEGFVRERNKASTGGGRGKSRGYSWVENREDNTITVVVDVPIDCNRKKISNKLTNKSWQFGLHGCFPIIEGEFYKPVNNSESYWVIESKGKVQVTIQKSYGDSDIWPELLKGEEQFNSEKDIEKERAETLFNMDDKIEQVLNAMWKYNQTYQAVTQQGQQSPVWYVMDEAGCALAHSSVPNCCCSPFVCCTTGKVYSILWPIKDMWSGDMFTRDFCPPLNVDEPALQRKARQLLFEKGFNCFDEAVDVLSSQIDNKNPPSQQFVQVPLNETEGPNTSNVITNTPHDVKIFIETGSEPASWISTEGVCLVDDATDSDIMWISDLSSVNDKPLKQSQCIVRFVGDECLTHQDKLAKTIKTAGLSDVSWLPVTWDLRYQLLELIADHRARGIFNWWIVKRCIPSSRSSQFPLITDDIRRIVRLVETGPCIASHYYLSSLLFNGKRLALGYLVIVLSVDPLDIIVHTVPLVRVCSKDAGGLSDYDHYDCSSLITTCNNDTNWDSVVSEFRRQLEGREEQWKDIERKVYQMIKDIFSAVSDQLSQHPVCCCRGVYLVNVLLLSSFQPLLLSVDPLPDGPSSLHVRDVISVLCQKRHETMGQTHNFVSL